MPNQQIASFRRVTPAILAAQQLAQQTVSDSIAKKDLAMALKRSAPVLKITGTPYQILDILLGMVRKEDLKAGGRPLVAISNEKLASYTDRSQRTVSRCLKRLVEAGVLAYADSPNGRRFVRRGSDGAVDYGYGLDLTPACNRLSELQEMAVAFQDQLKQEKQARRHVVARARAITDLASLLGESASHVVERMEDVLSQPLDPIYRAALLEEIYQETLLIQEEMSCLGDKNDASISNTTQSHFKKIVDNERNGSNEPYSKSCPNNGANASVEKALDEKYPDSCAPSKAQNLNHKAFEHTANSLPSALLSGVSIGLLNQACREVCELLQVKLTNWNALFAVSEDLRHLIGLSQAGWTAACTSHGKHLATASLLVVAEKALRDPDAINRPAGYFRAMIERAKEGKLNLQKSVFGLAQTGAITAC